MEKEELKILEELRRILNSKKLIGTVISGFLAVFRRNSDFSPNYNHFSSPNNWTNQKFSATPTISIIVQSIFAVNTWFSPIWQNFKIYLPRVAV